MHSIKKRIELELDHEELERISRVLSFLKIKDVVKTTASHSKFLVEKLSIESKNKEEAHIAYDKILFFLVSAGVLGNEDYHQLLEEHFDVFVFDIKR